MNDKPVSDKGVANLDRQMLRLISDNEQGQAAVDGRVREMLASPGGRLMLNNLLRTLDTDPEGALMILDHNRRLFDVLRTLAASALAGAIERLGPDVVGLAMLEQAESGARAAAVI